jgi:hypothetical protein
MLSNFDHSVNLRSVGNDSSRHLEAKGSGVKASKVCSEIEHNFQELSCSNMESSDRRGSGETWMSRWSNGDGSSRMKAN